MFNKRKKEREAILRDLRIIKRLLETDQKPVAKKLVVETVTSQESTEKLYRSIEVAKELGLTIGQFDNLRKKVNQKPIKGGGQTGTPSMWSRKQIIWFKDYLKTGAHKTRNRRQVRLLTPDQAADFVGIGKNSFMKLVEKGEIPFKVLNSDSKFVHRRFRKSDLEQWLSNNEWRLKV
jgi:predicted DNA-binding transcriptional regulator AlpA